MQYRTWHCRALKDWPGEKEPRLNLLCISWTTALVQYPRSSRETSSPCSRTTRSTVQCIVSLTRRVPYVSIVVRYHPSSSRRSLGHPVRISVRHDVRAVGVGYTLRVNLRLLAYYFTSYPVVPHVVCIQAPVAITPSCAYSS